MALFSSETLALAATPNLLVILADDLGYGDLGCTGSKTIATPNIDALAESGVLCSRGYVASAVCSPSRAGLITGRDPRRFGYEGNLNNGASAYAAKKELLGLSTSERTIGDQLQNAGYATAYVGKWHLGDQATFHPNQRGFDYFCGMLGGNHTYFPDPLANKIERNGAPLKEFSSGYLTDFFTDEAVAWIDKHEDGGKPPWLLFLSYNAPHTPMEAKNADLQAYEHINNSKRRTYAAMVAALDRGVGRVLNRLEEAGERDNTLIVFLSDNGGATDNGSWNGLLSGAKGSLREGGIRVPMIWSWPGTIRRGETCKAVVSSLDITPTFVAAAGSSLMPLKQPLPHEDAGNRRKSVQEYGSYDGVNLLPLLTAGRQPEERRLFWRLQGQAAVMRGDLKLVRLMHRPAQLFDVASGVAETDDLASVRSADHERLFRELGEWEATLATVPIWDSSPRWWGASADIYDNQEVKPEPQ